MFENRARWDYGFAMAVGYQLSSPTHEAIDHFLQGIFFAHPAIGVFLLKETMDKGLGIEESFKLFQAILILSKDLGGPLVPGHVPEAFKKTCRTIQSILPRKNHLT